MNDRIKEQIKELEIDKKIIKDTINKDSDLTIADFENFVRIKYGVTQIYNSAQEYYLKVFNQRIDDEIDQYIDCLCLGIVETTHKVFEITNPKKKNKIRDTTAVYYSYSGNYVIDIFIEVGEVIEDAGCFFLFRKDGEKKCIEEIESYYSLTEEQEDEIIRQLLADD